MFKFSMPSPVAQTYGPVFALVLYAFVAGVSALCIVSFALMTIDSVPDEKSLRSRAGTIDRLSLGRLRRGNAVHYALELRDEDGARVELRIADWLAGAIDQLELARVTPGTPVVLRYHEHGWLGTRRDVYELNAAGQSLLTYHTAMTRKRADVEERRTSTGPLGVAGFSVLLVTMLWSFVRYEVPVLKLRRPGAGTPSGASDPRKSLAHRIGSGLWSLVTGVLTIFVERILGLLRLPLLPVRYLGFAGTGALLILLACAWAFVSWDGQLPQRSALTQVSGVLTDARKMTSGRQVLLHLVVQPREGEPNTLTMYPSNLQAAGLHDSRLPALIGKPFAIEFEQSVFANTLYIHGLAAGGETYITWERSQERYETVARNERLAASAAGLVGIVLIAIGIKRRRAMRIA